MNALENKVVLVTGAGRGIGRTLAESFASHGAQVCANDISPLNVEAVCETITAQGGRARAYVMDIAKKMSAQALLNEVTDDFGQIDVLVNAAAVEPRGALLKMDEWDIMRTLQVNLIGAFVMTQSAGRIMRAQGGGLILNIAPLAGRESARDRAAYVASKFGLIGFTRQAALELAEEGIRINLLGSGLGPLATHNVSGHDIAELALSFCCGEWQHATGWLVNLS